MTVLAGQLLLCDQPGAARIAPGYIRIDGDQIAKVVEGELPANPDVGGVNALICPGFIDAHLHLSQFDMIGAHGMPLLSWLDQVTYPTERDWSNAAKVASRRALRKCLAYGTTGICAYATTSAEATLITLQHADELGMRGIIGQVLMDRHAPDYLLAKIDDVTAETEGLLKRFPPESRLAAAVTPRFAISCSASLLEQAGSLAQQHGAAIQTHLAETRRECQQVEELFDGKRYVDVYRDAGLLTSRTVLGHGIYLDDNDLQVISQHDSVIAHCPTANSFLRSGTMNRRMLLDHGVKIALGSDVGAGYEHSMVRVARAMIEAASSTGDTFPSATEAWYQITAGNADSLGWPRAGRLAAGDSADVLVVQPRVPWLESNVDPLATLLWQWDDRWISHIYLQGKDVSDKAFRV